MFNLPGGTPEPGDAGLAAILVREAFEESQVRVGAAAYLRDQEVRRRRGRRMRRCGWHQVIAQMLACDASR